MWIETTNGFINLNKFTDIRFKVNKEEFYFVFNLYACLYCGDKKQKELLLIHRDETENRFNWVKDNLLEYLKKKLSVNSLEVLNLKSKAFELEAEYDRMTKTIEGDINYE